MKPLIKFWTTIIVGIVVIESSFNWLESHANTNAPPYPKTPAQLESAKIAAATNRISVAPAVELNRANQLFVHGALVGTVTTNGFAAVPQVPGFNEGVQIGAQIAKRNPDVKDARMLVIIAAEAWQAMEKGGKQ